MFLPKCMCWHELKHILAISNTKSQVHILTLQIILRDEINHVVPSEKGARSSGQLFRAC